MNFVPDGTAGFGNLRPFAVPEGLPASKGGHCKPGRLIEADRQHIPFPGQTSFLRHPYLLFPTGTLIIKTDGG